MGPLEALDGCILIVAVVFLCGALLAYRLTPQLSAEEPKPSFISFCLATWVLPKIRASQVKPMSLSDLPRSRGTATFNADVFVDRLHAVWSPGKTGIGSLGVAVVRLMLPGWAAVHAVRGPGMMCVLLDAYVISCIVAFVAPGDGSGFGVACKIALLVVVKEILSDLLYCMSWLVLHNTGVIRVVVPLQVLILRKLRDLGPECMARTPATAVQQLMQDLRKLDDLLWSNPVNTVGIDAIRGLVALWQVSMIYGAASILTGVVTGTLLFYLQTRCSSNIRDARDRERNSNHARLESLKEITDSMEALKLYAWTDTYLVSLRRSAAGMAAAARDAGRWLALSDWLGAAIGDAFCVIAFFASTFVTRRDIDFKDFILAEVYVQVLRESVGNAYSSYSKTKDIFRVTKQVEAFLSLPERQLQLEGPPLLEGADFEWPVALSDGTVGRKPVLFSLDFDVAAGELILVSGPVGSGKTSLLLSMLGETRFAGGMARLPEGPVAFQPQIPYLLDGTLRQNVIFGVDEADANEADVRTALIAAQLGVDMDNTSSTLHALREHTPVGRRGCDISGGQRARTALARMVYATLRGVSTVFLDDPVASIDNEMVASAWKAAVLQAMCGTTRIVVVNSQLLPRLGPDADRIVLLEDGKIVYNGRPGSIMADVELVNRLGTSYVVPPRRRGVVDALRASQPQDKPWETPTSILPLAGKGAGGRPGGSFLAKVWKQCGLAKSCFPCPVVPRTWLTRRPSKWENFDRLLQAPDGRRGNLLRAPQAVEAHACHSDASLRSPQVRRDSSSNTGFDAGRRDQAWTAASNDTDLHLCVAFFRRMAWWASGSMIATVLAEAMVPLASAFLSRWAGGALPLSKATCYLVFVCLVSGRSVLNSVGGLLKQFGLAHASLGIRGDLDRALVSLSMPYFWCGGTTADVRSVVTADLDDLEPLSSIPIGVAQSLFGLCAVLVTVPLAVPLVVIAGVAWRRVAFPKTWVFLQVIPLCNKHVYQQPLTIAAEEHDNHVAIRAFKAQGHFDAAMQRAAMCLPYIRFYLWSALLFKDVLSIPIKAAFVASAMGCVLHVKSYGGDPSTAVLLYSICWGLVKKINDLNWKLDKAVERLAQYRNIEAFIHTKYKENDAGATPPEGWPSAGVISFEQVSFRYFPHGPLALQGATVFIQAGEKVGVVGPTGGGKTTFLKLLFRLGPLQGVPPSSGGRLRIDGIDIATLKLKELRQAIGVVPQEPTIFRGTLRENLMGTLGSSGHRQVDSVGSAEANADDAEALTALAACGLEQLASRRAALDEMLSADLSVGSKQLLAAARVILRRPRVLVLDEATASLSQTSADLLMRVVAEQCSGATVLSIAHRLRYILRCDRVIVLGRGGTVEAFDAPAELGRNIGGYFANQLRSASEQGPSLPPGQ